MPFIEDKDFTSLEDEDGVKVELESNELQIINRDAYRMFASKLISFNNKYAKKLKDQNPLDDPQDTYVRNIHDQYQKNKLVNTKYPLNIDVFYRLNHRWRSIAKRYYASKEDPTGLKNIRNGRREDEFPSAHIELLKQTTKELYRELSELVTGLNLGTPYINKYKQERMDYTEIAKELLELSLLATHAYTDVFYILDREYSSNSYEKRESLARSMHTTYYDDAYRLPRRSNAIDPASDDLINNPMSLKNFFGGYTEENFVERAYSDERNKWKPKEETEAEKEKRRQEIEKIVNERKEAERIAEEKRMEEEQKLKEEQERIAKVQEAKERLDSLRTDNEKVKQAFPIVPNDEHPSKVNEAFYAYFAKFADRMGIDQNTLNAQSIIQAASISYLTEQSRRFVEPNTDTNSEPLLKSLVPIYEQIQRITYEAYVEKCLKENIPIDLNVPSDEALDLMSVAMYTMYPTAFDSEKKDISTLAIISYVLNGHFSGNAMSNNIASRDIVMELAKASYQEKDVSFFTADAEARFESFTTQKKSSKNIIAETAAQVNLYNKYKTDRANSADAADTHTAHQEANLKKEAMDAAYALERRIETRYKSRLARFFRYFSYSNQKEELERVKKILEIPNNERVADHIKDSRIRDLFVDASGRNLKEGIKQRSNRVGNHSDKYIMQLLEKHLGKDNIPKITKEDFNKEDYQRAVRYSNLTPAAIEAAKRMEKEREKEQIEREYQEELRRKNEKHGEEELQSTQANEEADVVEAVSEEDLEAAKLEEELRARQEEEMRAQAKVRELRKQEEKEKLFNAEIARISRSISNLEAENAKLELKRKNTISGCKQKEQEMLNKIESLDEEKRQIKYNNDFLAEKLNALIEQVGQQALGTMDSKDMEKFMNTAAKEAQKNTGKTASNRKITNAEQVSANIQDDQVVQGYMGAIESFRLELGKGEDRITAIANEKIELNKQIAAQGRIAEENAGPGFTERENLNQIKRLREKIDDMQKNKEAYLSDDKALGFNEAEFDAKLKAELEIAKGLSDESDIRMPLKIEIGVNENIAPVSSKVEEIDNPQKEIIK